MLSNLSFLMKTEIVTGAERYNVVHKYLSSKIGMGNIGIYIAIGILLMSFIGYCCFEYRKMKRRDRY